MDVDNDIDGQLLQQFSSMGTTDKDVLISEFQKLLGPDKLNPAGCAFFLDMNNWNLQAAICSYYDFDQPNVRLPSMKFLMDVTIGEGEAVPPSTNFIKTWKIQNSGEEVWPPGCCLKYCLGDNLSNSDRAVVDPLQPGDVTDVSVEMQSPAAPGVYQSQWRMSTPTGLFFGDVIWVIIQVEEGGLLDITQKLSKFGTDSFGQTASNVMSNPFASPVKQNFDDLCASNCSPNSSIVAQQGSPFSPNPLISPLSTAGAQGSPRMGQFSPESESTNQSTTTTLPTARSLFQVPQDCDISEEAKSSDIDLS
ncbi:hypothetical protein FSP39_013980 [Pinctada imbricata]|uniref:Nbr1 FW domain-containing protein n=1 Tax=Pinctada imbricata TaxID=66713 RepID=A0AA89C7K6_PINIB|nr:hypothetical protein FSP39_013980 [Pinctada imbricata]